MIHVARPDRSSVPEGFDGLIDLVFTREGSPTRRCILTTQLLSDRPAFDSYVRHRLFGFAAQDTNEEVVGP